MGDGVGVGDGLGVGVVFGVGDGLGVAGGTSYETSFENVLSKAVVLYAVTAKKYVVPPPKFDTSVVVAFPTSMVCV